MKTLVIGYGSELRGDDGLGPHLARLLAVQFPRMDIRTYHQLNWEIAADFEGFDRVLFIDASINGDDITLAPAPHRPPSDGPSTHFVGAEGVVWAASQLYNAHPDVWICTIKGEDFGIKDRISDGALLRAERAYVRLRDFLSKSYSYA